MDCEKITKNIRRELKSYITDNGLKCLVIGVSGGIDSALCCVLARPVCDELSIPLIGRSIPIETNRKDEIERAKMIGKILCWDFKEVDLTFLYHVERLAFEALEGVELSKIAKGNLKARSRMKYLYWIAGDKKGIVLSTDVYTEYLLGFFTLCGDVGDYGMIQHLWKTEVYELNDYFVKYYRDGTGLSSLGDFSDLETPLKQKTELISEALFQCGQAVPTDGLGITDSDLEQLEAESYEEVDQILKTWLTIDKDCFCWDDRLEFLGRPKKYEDFIKYRNSIINHPVVLRHERTHFKRTWPINIDREKIFKNQGT